MKYRILDEVEVCYYCGSPHIIKNQEHFYFGIDLKENELLHDTSFQDSVYCFNCGDYTDSTVGMLVLAENKLYVIAENYDTYRIAEIPCFIEDDSLYFEREVIHIAEIPANQLDLHERYSNAEHFVENLLNIVATKSRC